MDLHTLFRGKIYIAIVVLIPHVVIANLPCTPKSSLSSQIKIGSANQIAIHTVLQTLLRKGDTACYELGLTDYNTTTTNTNNTILRTVQTNHLLVKISLENVWVEYEVKKDYNFTTPALDVRCTCDCPGGDDKCNKNYESEYNCDEHKSKPGFCFRYYAYGHSSSGCFFYFDSAEVCCSVSIYKASSDVYRAYYIASPKIYYKLNTILTDYKGKILKDSSCVVSPENGQSVPGNGGCNIAIETSGHAVVNLPNSLWLYKDPKNSKLMVNSRINDVDETSFRKLGWFKYLSDDSNEIFHLRRNDARHALHIDMHNCVDDKYTWTFDAVGYLKPQHSGKVELDKSEFGEPIEEFYKSSIEKVVTKYRTIIVYPRTTASIAVHATLDFPADVVIFQTMSKFDNFQSRINFDKFGNKMLEIEIFNGFGTLYVSVGGNNDCPVETHSFTITKNFEKWEKQIKLSHCVIGEQNVCLHTFDRNTTKCSTALYSEEFFTLNARTLQPAVEGDNLNLAQSGGWLASLDDWFSNLFGSFKSVMVLIGLLLFTIAIICLLRGPISQCFKYLCGKNNKFKYSVQSTP